MLILAFDLATTSGWCCGNAGARVPASGAVRLRSKGESIGRAGANLIREIEGHCHKYGRPDFIVKEAPLSMAAQRRLGDGARSMEVKTALHTVVETFCALHGIECRDIDMGRARKQFTGRAHHGGSEETKRAVLARCHLLGLMPRLRVNTDQSDAICTWWGACAELAFTSPKVLHLFGERP